MSTLTNALAMSKPASGDTSWDTEINGALDTLDYIAQPDNCYFVSPIFTSGNLANGSAADRRHFDTVQGAITAAQGTGVYTTIFIYPGAYTETLTATGNFGLVGLSSTSGRTVNGGRRVELYGTGSSPLLTVNPTISLQNGISFTNIHMGHQYSASTGNQTWPMLVHVTDQYVSAPGDYPANRNNYTFSNCYFRKDSPISDDFDYCFRFQGYNQVQFDNCDFKFPTGVGNFGKPISIEGNNAQGAQALLFARNTNFNHDGTDDQTIYMDNSSDGKYFRCASQRVLANIVTFGVTGINQCDGLNSSGEFTSWGNLDSIDAAML